MEEIILKGDGSPFVDPKAAAMRGGTLKKQGVTTRVVEVEGGYGLKKVRETRPKRVPIGKRNVLSAAPEEGYEQRFVNDVEDRIEVFEQAGWEVAPKTAVGDEMVGNESSVGGKTTKNVGGGVTAVLMRKRKDWFDEDYAEKQREIDDQEKGLIRQTQKDGHYGKIKID